MELGGNAPFLIFDDADLDSAVDGALLAKMRNIGEACTSANRFHVAEPVREEFERRLAEKMGSLKIGRGTEEDVEGRPADRPALAREGLRARPGRARQGRHLRGRRRDPGRARLLLPADRARRRADDARVLREEIFGPVAPVTGFESEEDAIARANDTEYGLVAYVFTRDIKRALRVCEGSRPA